MHRYADPRPWWLLVLVFVLTHGAAVCAAVPPVVLDEHAPARTALNGHIELLIDADARHRPADVVQGRADAAFRAPAGTANNIGFTRADVWARFRVETRSTVRHVLVLPRPLLDYVTLYRVTDDGAVTHVATGDARPFALRPVAYRGFAFPLASQSATYYLHIHSPTSAIGLPLRIVAADSFNRFVSTENYLLGGYVGFMVGLAVCALILFGLVRVPAFAYYAAYIAAFTALISIVNGYGAQLLWPNVPLAQQVMPTVACSVGILTGIMFARRFLNLPQVAPASDAVFVVAAICATFGAALHVVQASPLGMLLVIGTAIALCPIVFIFSLRAAWAGDRVAGYFSLGWIAYSVGVTVAALDMTAIIPDQSWPAYGLYFGSLGEFVALAIGLSDRLWNLQRARAAQIAAANADLASLNANLERIVMSRTQELEARNRELSELAVRDSLTGLYNHSTAIELLEQLLQQSQRYEFPVATVMVDLDNFKQLNDTYGHQLGDKVLEEVSQTLSESVRGADVVGRYGGEEFIIVMPHADSPAAREYGERLLARIREIDVGQAEISASIGISVFHPRGHRASAQEVIRRADEALYRSKRDGRNRLTVDSLSVIDGHAARH